MQYYWDDGGQDCGKCPRWPHCPTCSPSCWLFEGKIGECVQPQDADNPGPWTHRDGDFRQFSVMAHSCVDNMLNYSTYMDHVSLFKPSLTCSEQDRYLMKPVRANTGKCGVAEGRSGALIDAVISCKSAA